MNKKINKYLPKVLSGVLSLTILCCTVGVTAYSAGADTAETTSETQDKSVSLLNSGKTLTKDETVYVIAGADGGAKKIIVSDWIKNADKLNTINDVSNLTDIKNIKGDESYTMNEDNMCVWDAEGSDIYYQGTSDKQLPVELSVSYQLDGKTISADDLAGKSGKVTMRFDYKNNQYETVSIDGNDEKIYVPYIMLTGTILDNENFRNVEVSNGKVLNDGDRTIVAGFALPGMANNLDIDKDTLDIPDYVEITADVTDFTLETTMTLASNSVFNDVDFSDVNDNVDKLTEDVNKMGDATDSLIDGSSQLYDGISTLLDKSGELIDGVTQLADGAQQLNSGASSLNDGANDLNDGVGTLNNGAQTINGGVAQLDNGASDLNSGASSLNSGALQLRDGIASLASGLGTISSNSETLNSAAKQVFGVLLSTADDQIAAAGLTADKLTIDNFDDVLTNLISSLDESKVRELAYDTALKAVTARVNEQREYIKALVESKVRDTVLEGVLSAVGMPMTADDYRAAVAAGQIPAEVQAQVNQAVEAKMQSGEIQALIEQKTEEQIQELIEQNMQSEEVQSQIEAAVEKAKQGAKALESLKTQLDSYNQFYQGLLTYTSGVDTANAGSQELLSGANTLTSGTDTLLDGTNTLKNGTSSLLSGSGTLLNGTGSLLDGTGTLLGGTNSLLSGTNTLSDSMGTLTNGSSSLVSGVSQLKDGALQLSDGLKQFKEEGVQKLVDLANGDVKTITARLQATVDVSKKYKSYSGIAEDMDGQVNFVYKTDSIKSAND